MKEANKVVLFNWFDWLITIICVLVILMFLPSTILNLLAGSFYVTGKGEESFVIGLIWIVTFGLGLRSKIRKYRKAKIYRP
jgi:hypothetical protein